MISSKAEESLQSSIEVIPSKAKITVTFDTAEVRRSFPCFWKPRFDDTPCDVILKPRLLWLKDLWIRLPHDTLKRAKIVSYEIARFAQEHHSYL
jgi:hypothetical protein